MTLSGFRLKQEGRGEITRETITGENPLGEQSLKITEGKITQYNHQIKGEFRTLSSAVVVQFDNTKRVV